MDPAILRFTILSITAAGVMLLMVWLITQLFHDWQHEHITAGRFISTVILLAVIVTFLFAFLGGMVGRG